MRSLLSSLIVACGVLSAFVTHTAAAGVDMAKLQSEILDTWTVTVAGDSRTRSLYVTGAEPKSDSSLSLKATYGWTATGQQAPVNASLTATGNGYKLEFVTDANSLIVAESSDLKTFVGTFKPVKGDARSVTLSRAAAESSKGAGQGLVLQTGPDAASQLTVRPGDRWTWNVDDRSDTMRGCSPGYPKGAQEIETVTAIGGDTYVTEIVGPGPGSRLERWNFRDGSYRAVLEGKEIRSSPILFPLAAGKTWETTLVGAAVTALTCRAGAIETLKLAKGTHDVVPVACKGQWKNTRSGNSGDAEYKYWFSPAVGRSVRRTVSTWSSGSYCADIEYVLESYSSAPK
jgi:hypothetical protein